MAKPVEPVLYELKIDYLGSDCYGEWCVDCEGSVFERHVGWGYTWKASTYEKLLADRQQQLSAIEKDIRAIEAVRRKVNERLHNIKQYVHKMRKQREALRRQWLEGSWDIEQETHNGKDGTR